MAPRDSDWQVTDVILDPTLAERRFIQGIRDGTRWYVWFEQGGMGRWLAIAIFDLPKSANAPVSSST